MTIESNIPILDPAVHQNIVSWLIVSAEPWTRHRTLVDLLHRPEAEPAVIQTRQEMGNFHGPSRVTDPCP